ncbi:ParB/RepB/Spo0J family partition protein [Nocardia sp. NBC_01327]|uniref:ParB/RepB/Spo0J family partition protein n=1 Tax=Nocardia sp. NBC_01327 TaxID=2903593 RepID=UPI002E165E38|nr:ParB N-terminal domain-containing protein [Nocardia sp. NBC_01327]
MHGFDCGVTAGTESVGCGEDVLTEIDRLISNSPVKIATGLLRDADSPRLDGEDIDHIAALAETDTALPPIIVHRRSMRVIDGMHRLRAAEIRGSEEIEVIFFDGTESDAFAIAVRTNVSHGLPLSTADRRAAAIRLLEMYPDRSDRSIAVLAGLAAKTVASIRHASVISVADLKGRIGRDGKTRPVNSEDGRRRASELIKEKPHASLREIAKAAGISPATAGDVRARLARGENPVPDKVKQARRPAEGSTDRCQATDDLLRALQRDPSLRLTDSGRALLRLMNSERTLTREWEQSNSNVPPHCVELVARIAREFASCWTDLADSLIARNHTTVA